MTLLLWLVACGGTGDDPDTDLSVETELPAGCDGDADCDGFAADIDCDDADAAVHPGAAETWYDGRDGDCAGGSDWDADADGWSIPGAPEGLPTDCDDGDPLVNPGVVKNDPAVRLGVPADLAPTAASYSWSEIFTVSGDSERDQHHATVSFGADGRFLTAWQSGDLGFAPNGVTRLFDGVEPVTAGDLLQELGLPAAKPDVEAWPGGYVVAWEEGSLHRVLIRGYDLDGVATTPPIVASEGNTIEAPDLAVFPDGSGVVIWVETGGTSGEGEHVIQRFGPDLQLVGGRVVIERAGWTVAEIAARPDGGLVMVATRKLPELADHLEVYGRVIAGDGCETSFRADQAESDGPSRPTLAVGADGRFAVTWRSKVEEGVGAGSYGRFFDADGTARSDSFLLSLPGEEANRSVVAYAGTDVIFAWEGHPDPSEPDAPESVYMWTWDAEAIAPASARITVSEVPAPSAERPAMSVFEGDDGALSLMMTWENVGPQVRVVGRIIGIAP